MSAEYQKYWGKADRKQPGRYHLLAYHALDVAACGVQMLRQNRFGLADLFAQLGMDSEQASHWCGYWCGLHDIGKFASGFQKLATLPTPPLVKPAAQAIYPCRHDSLGYWLWQRLYQGWRQGENVILPPVPGEQRYRYDTALNIWMEISCGHHGKPPEKDSAGVSLAFAPADIAAACAYLCDLRALFNVNDLPQAWSTKPGRRLLKQLSWQLAGIITLADWLGSDENNFPFDPQPTSLAQYWPQALAKAELALSRIPLSASCSAYQGFQHLFPDIYELTPLQQRAETLALDAPGPQLIVLEDVTGAGKTEAAMILTHRLMAAGKGDGLYIGLPTMATANAMYRRLGESYRALFSQEQRPSLVLAHGGRQMSDAFRDSVWSAETQGQQHYSSEDAAAGAECHRWFADSRKKALLADVGVGTLDQVLMAVMPFRHQSLRLLGMRNKILLLDEVHAYDGYMVRLLEGLLHFHAAQGGSAIVLSATLSASLRQRLLNAFSQGAGLANPEPEENAGYPWLSQLSAARLHEEPLQTRKEVQRSVELNWLTEIDRAIAIIYQALAAGQCICWVRNTVDDASEIYRRLQQEGKIPSEDLLLFHSRFIFADRLSIEDRTLDWFGRQGDASQRRGKVLIATQVVEQSLDLDFDVMISDLAPVDLLIQRTGRLKRHIRDAHGRCKKNMPDERPAACLHILAPEWQPSPDKNWPGEQLRGTGRVYGDHACLWRTQALLHEAGKITMPQMARQLVDGVYEKLTEAPPALQSSEDDIFGQLLSQRSAASQNLLERDSGYDRESSDFMWSEEQQLSTRLSELSVELYLGWLDSNGELQPRINRGEFSWELSRVTVRASWWQKHGAQLPQLSAEQLEQFRKQRYRPAAQLLLADPQQSLSWYSAEMGLCSNV